MHFKPTQRQREAIDKAKIWVTEGAHDSFILHGCAGSGKSTITSVILDGFDEVGSSYVLMSPTGKAARVLAAKTGREATTIHRRCYGFWRYEFEALVVDNTGETKTMTHIDLVSQGKPPSTEREVYRAFDSMNMRVLKMEGESTCRVTPACALGNYRYFEMAQKAGVHVTLDKIVQGHLICESEGLDELEEWIRDKYAQDCAYATKRGHQSPVCPWVDLIVVDEACMTGRAEADILRRYGVGLLLVGDPYQLPPINEDGPILAPLGTATVELDVVMRADGDKQDLLAAYAFFRGSSDLRTGQDTPNVQVRHISTAKPEEMFGAGAILSTTNSDVQMVNSTYRAALGLSGMDPQVGERVILTSNIDAPKGLVNGALFYVASCEEISNGYRLEVVPSDVVEVRIGLESPYEIFQAVPDLVKELRAEDEATLSERIGSGAAPNIITIPATLHKSGFDCDHMAADKEFCKRAMRLSDMHFGYGLTVHKVQGSEFSKVVFYENSWWPKRTAQDEFIYRCLVYTAMTRGKSQIWAFTKRCQYYGKKVDQHEAA